LGFRLSESLLAHDARPEARALPEAQKHLPKPPIMFTLEESALLSRMLRFIGWAVLAALVGIVAYLVIW